MFYKPRNGFCNSSVNSEIRNEPTGQASALGDRMPFPKGKARYGTLVDLYSGVVFVFFHKRVRVRAKNKIRVRVSFRVRVRDR